MRTIRLGCLIFVCASFLLSQAPPISPVVNPRGVINAFTQQPAPTTVGSGGIIWITGLNFGPPEGAKANGSPLPNRLGGVRVLVNGRPIPLISVSTGQIVAQVPWEINPGNQAAVAQLVVENADGRSLPVRFYVRGSEPSLRAVDDQGYGPVAGNLVGSTLKVAATGLGPVDPAATTGEAGPADPLAQPKGELRAFIGGIPAKVKAALSPVRVGQFDLEIEMPEGAQSGDVLQLTVGNRPANRLTVGSIKDPDVRFLSLPEGAELNSITGSDLKGSFVTGSGERDETGCYPSYIFDFARKAASPVDGCLTAAGKNAVSPMIPVQEGAALVAFEGPPEGSLPDAVSSKVRIFNPALEGPLSVSLFASATQLATVDGETAAAVIPGSPASIIGIDVNTGETRPVTGAGIGAGGGQATPGAAGAGGLSLDLGDGLNHVLSARTAAGQGRSAVAVGDDADHPTRAKLAILDQAGEVVETRDFPEGFVPLIGPANAPRAGAPVIQQARLRVALNYDSTARILYMLSRKPDDTSQGLSAFGFGPNAVDKAIPFADGWFAASCTANLQIYSLELSRRLAMMITNKPETEIQQPCQALGYAVLDLASQKMEAVPISGNGFVSVESVTDMNDYLIGTNAGNARQPADALHVLDSVTSAVFRLQPPPGVNNFGALRPVPAMGLLVAPAQDRVAGDQGIVVFDLENASARVLTVPDQFAAMSIVDILPATRAIVARGVRSGNSGAQYLIYDLVTTDLMVVPNPDGVAWVGGVPLTQTPGVPGAGAQQASPRVYQDSNPKANTVSAVCFDSDRNQTGVMMIRVP